MSFVDVVFTAFTNVSGGEFLAAFIIIGIFFLIMLISLRFSFGAGFILLLGAAFALHTYFPVHQAITSFYILLLIGLGAALALFFYRLFATVN